MSHSSRRLSLIVAFVVAVVVFGAGMARASSPDVSLVINGTQADPDVSPWIESGRTMVPVRVISESLGWKVDWLSESRQVLITRQEKSASEYALLAIGEREALVDGEEVFIDVPPTIRSGRTMLPIRFVAEALGCEVAWDDETRTVTVSKKSQENDGGDSPASEEKTAGNGLYGVSMVNDEAHYGLKMSISGDYRWDTVRDSQERLMLHIGGVQAASELTSSSRYFPEAPVREVMVENGDSDGLYVTLEFRENVLRRVVEVEDGLLVEFACLSDIILAGEGEASHAEIYTTHEVSPRTFTLRDPARLVLDFPGVTPGDLPREDTLSEGYISRYRIGRHRRSLGDSFDGTRVVLKLSEDRSPAISTENVDEGSCVRVSLGESSMAGRVVVIDPGHGGGQPGGQGYSGTYEKYVNMSIARYTVKFLKEAGAEVVLTRDGDYGVPLYDRPAMANEAGADVFVSIHCNADPLNRFEGTETYRYPNHPDSLDLAWAIHSQLVHTLGRPDRGVRYGNFAVLREADMPATLLEIVYFTSALEEQLILNHSVQKRVARAIVEGLETFFAAH